MLIFGILPFWAWIYGPKWLRPYLILFGLVVLIGLGIALWRYIANDRRDVAAVPSRSEYRWPPGWDVASYHRVLLTFLKIEDWRILSARAVDADRLLLFLQRDRHHLPALLVRPGVEPVAADLDLLRAIQREDGLSEAVLISDTISREMMPDPQDGVLVKLFDFEALPYLAEELDGGPEEERRADALHTRQLAAARERRRTPTPLGWEPGPPRQPSGIAEPDGSAASP